ncbi:MAG: HAMP domain-containing histidine kinase [Coriobacteriia bacterium]|nr:HAMP domain-containing histidine kinase [Coriobacteriia bacterium]
MKGSMKWLLLFFLALALATCASIAWTMTLDYEVDRVELNRVARAVEANWPDALQGQLPESHVHYLFIEGEAPVYTQSESEDIRIAIYVDSERVGTIVVSNEATNQLVHMRAQLLIVFVAALVLLAIGAGLYALYLQRTILRPFRKLETFASSVAQGDLDFPLEMDKENRFGAFTESFDLMREELALARENERLANVSKKELVASLSHDIKTPVASIKAISELHQAKYGASSEMETITGKADQVDQLISNMFSATLEELQQLEVSTGEVTSTELEKYIRSSDHQNKIHPFNLPECVITADSLRLQQVIDNIIGNSYKYAGTSIEVTGSFEESFFVLVIRDFGLGVSSEELPLLTEKYYRADNAEGKNGAGLGLYLSHYFLTKMGGSLTVESHEGLQVILRLKI